MATEIGISINSGNGLLPGDTWKSWQNVSLVFKETPDFQHSSYESTRGCKISLMSFWSNVTSNVSLHICWNANLHSSPLVILYDFFSINRRYHLSGCVWVTQILWLSSDGVAVMRKMKPLVYTWQQPGQRVQTHKSLYTILLCPTIHSLAMYLDLVYRMKQIMSSL